MTSSPSPVQVELHTNQLEDLLMKEHGINYKTARQIVLESRNTLGMSKFAPWTEDLKAAAERLYEIRYADGTHANDAHGNGAHQQHHHDTDSTTTPKTLQSLSYDASEDNIHNHNAINVTTSRAMKKSMLSNDNNDNTEEPTETENAEYSTTMIPSSSTANSGPNNKKKNKDKSKKKDKKNRRSSIMNLGRCLLCRSPANADNKKRESTATAGTSTVGGGRPST